MAELLLTGSALVLGLLVLLWLVSVWQRDASLVDIFWGLGFVILAWLYAARGAGDPTRTALVVSLVTIWGVRLAGYLARRNLGRGEDRRYTAMREHWGPRFWLISLFTVYLLQGLLIVIVSLPLAHALMAPAPAAPTWLDGSGFALWAVGLMFEAVGDFQLARFKADPASRGQVLDHGVWRYTRHPNYFGDFCVWWGLYLVAIAAPGGWWTAIGPLLMSGLLLKVSGVALLEKDIAERRPGYHAYAARTPAFFPWWPRDAG